MIYTITLNPALDHGMEIRDLQLDDANRISAEQLYAGGKGIDVSRALRRLGGDSMALGFSGGHNGQTLTDLLKAEGVTPYFTPIAEETRRNILLSIRKRGRQTVLHTPGPRVTTTEWASFLLHLGRLDLRDCYVVVGGSLPRGVPPVATRQVITQVQRQGARAILDADGTSLREGLKARPFAVKPNVHELQRAVGRPLRTEAQLLDAALSLQRRGVAIVLVSRGPLGLLVVSGSARLRAIPPKVRVRSTVGAGDSTVAGFVLAHSSGKALEECVRSATAAGTAATLEPGNQLCAPADVLRLRPRIVVSAVC